MLAKSYLTCPDGHTTEQTGASKPVCTTCGYSPGEIISDWTDGLNVNICHHEEEVCECFSSVRNEKDNQ